MIEKNNISLMLIEDDEVLGQGLQAFLQQEGFACLWLRDVCQVFNLWVQADLVILDRQFPDGDSLRFLPQWLAKKALPVIVLTARVAVDDRVAGLEAGARDYLTKHFPAAKRSRWAQKLNMSPMVTSSWKAMNRVRRCLQGYIN